MARMALAIWTVVALLGGSSSAQGPTPTPGTTIRANAPTPDAVVTYTLPPETLARAEALYRTRVAMLIVGTVYGFTALVLLLTLRVAPRVRDG